LELWKRLKLDSFFEKHVDWRVAHISINHPRWGAPGLDFETWDLRTPPSHGLLTKRSSVQLSAPASGSPHGRTFVPAVEVLLRSLGRRKPSPKNHSRICRELTQRMGQYLHGQRPASRQHQRQNAHRKERYPPPPPGGPFPFSSPTGERSLNA
jgi:hypothetical protein